jgi:hypothetical protein
MRPADDLDRREIRTDLAAESPNRRLARHRFLARRKFLESLGGAAIGMATVKGRSGAQDRSAGDGPVVPANPRSLVAKGRAAAAATVHPLATQAAMNAFRRGGNAIDAAVAAAFMLGVVDGHNSGIGGGCLILARLADGRLIATFAERDKFGLVCPRRAGLIHKWEQAHAETARKNFVTGGDDYVFTESVAACLT